MSRLLIALVGLVGGVFGDTAQVCSQKCMSMERPWLVPFNLCQQLCGALDQGIGQGEYYAAMISVQLPVDIATSFLPEELELAPQEISDEGMHPVVFAFGHQSHVQPALGIDAFDLSYLEFIHAVPYTQFKEGLGYPNRGPFCYSPVLYLDNNEFSSGEADAAIAVLLGWFYGLEKEFGNIDAADTAGAGYHYVTTKLGGLPIISGDWNITGDFQPTSSFPNFAATKAAMGQRLVGKSKLGEGFYECARFDWGMDEATMAPIVGSISVSNRFVGDMPAQDIAFAGIDRQWDGGWMLKNSWSMTPPLPCKRLPQAPSGPKKKVAILGGGLSGIVSAYYLSSVPDFSEHFDVTIYQMGHMLGGKTASTKDQREGHGHHNLEHGLHIMMGWYDNVFMMLREVMAELGTTWNEYFDPANDISLTLGGYFGVYDTPNEDYYVMDAFLPSLVPGEPGEPHRIPSPYQAITSIIKLLKKVLSSIGDGNEHSELLAKHSDQLFASHVHSVGKGKAYGALEEVHARLDSVAPLMTDDLERYGELKAALFEQRDELVQLLQTAHDVIHEAMAVAPAREHVRNATERRRELGLHEKRGSPHAEPPPADVLAKIGLQMTDMMLSMAKGMLLDGVLFGEGYEAINHLEGVEWCLSRGMEEESIHNPLMLAGYDLVFGYKGDDVGVPNMAAGTALFGLVNMMSAWHGSFFYKFNDGMGDIFALPVYEVMKRRGVKVHFFHKVEELGGVTEHADGTLTVDEVRVRVQATPLSGDPSDYDPFVRDEREEPFWPVWPLYDRLQEGETLRGIHLDSYYTPYDGVKNITLKRGEDFDDLIFAMSANPLFHTCQPLMEASAQFADMVKNQETIATIAVQLVMKEDTPTLGYVTPSGEATTLTGFSEPLETWSDMTHLLGKESWGDRAKSIQYFCGPYPSCEDPDCPELSDFGYPDRMLERATEDATDWLKARASWHWKNVSVSHPHDGSTPLNFWDQLVVPPALEDVLSGPDRLAEQYIRVNVEPPERYVLSPAEKVNHRRAADDSGFANLFLAGDWVKNGINSGCAESATTGGMLASRAVGGYPVDGAFKNYEQQWGPPLEIPGRK